MNMQRLAHTRSKRTLHHQLIAVDVDNGVAAFGKVQSRNGKHVATYTDKQGSIMRKPCVPVGKSIDQIQPRYWEVVKP